MPRKRRPTWESEFATLEDFIEGEVEMRAAAGGQYWQDAQDAMKSLRRIQEQVSRIDLAVSGVVRATGWNRDARTRNR